jgi:thiamine pyrophosphokinase
VKVVVALAGEMQATELLRERVRDADLIVAADNGAARLVAIGLKPDRIIGDFDSIDPALLVELQMAGADVVAHPDPENKTDGQVAMELALEAGAREIVLLGAHGGERADHTLVGLLYAVARRYATNASGVGGRVTRMEGGRAGVGLGGGPEWGTAERRSVRFEGAVGDYVSLIPISAVVEGIETMGLRWAVGEGRLALGQAEGMSNAMAERTGGYTIDSGVALATHHFSTRAGAATRPRG